MNNKTKKENKVEKWEKEFEIRFGYLELVDRHYLIKFVCRLLKAEKKKERERVGKELNKRHWKEEKEFLKVIKEQEKAKVILLESADGIRKKERERVLGEIEKLREDLADLEHQQWESWSRFVYKKLDIGTSLSNLVKSLNSITTNWMKNWKPYSELDEKIKDADRIWADKIIEKLKQKLTNNK